MLTKNEFDILYRIKINNISDVKSFNEGLIQTLINKNLVELNNGDVSLTSLGEDELSKHKVDNAIIMAAGMSSRLAPISYETPKGLMKVRGEVLIERQIEQLQEAGIDDITIILGYLKERFFYLEDKYNVNIVINDDYYKYNNPSSLMKVIDKLGNSYVCSSDNYFSENVFRPYVYEGYYPAVYLHEFEDEYCAEFDDDGTIKKLWTDGDHDEWVIMGHVYFDRNFSSAFKKILVEQYDETNVKDKVWEYLYMQNLDKLKLKAKKYEDGIIFEFDTVEDALKLDKQFVINNESNVMNNICKYFECSKDDIFDIEAIKSGLTNRSFKFSVKDNGTFVYRHPGDGTEEYIDRNSEEHSMQIAKDLGLDDTFVFMDKKEGWKLSKYINNARTMDYNNAKEVSQALSMIRKLHDSNSKSSFDFDIWKHTLEYIDQLKDCGKDKTDDFYNLFHEVEKVYKIASKDKYARNVLCHNDCYDPNFLLDDDNNMYLIDWEYSGNDDPASDIGTFICCSEWPYDRALEAIEEYLQHKPDVEELKHYFAYVSVASYYWYVWALYQETRGNPMGEWTYLWYKNAKLYAKNFNEL